MKNTNKHLFFILSFFIFALFAGNSDGVFAAEQIPSSSLSIHSFDSQQLPNYPATAAIDGNASTFWTYAFNPVSIRTPHPHFLAIDLSNSYSVSKVQYLPRQDGGLYGTITGYEIYVSDDPDNWGDAVATGTFAGNSALKEVSFSAKNGRYVKLVSLGDAMNSVAAAAAEIRVFVPVNTVFINPNISIHSFDSQHLPSYPATAAIDGNASTFWTYAFNPVSVRTPHPHFLALDLGNNYPVEGFRYLPRQDGGLYGTITGYEIYVSDDPDNWGDAVATGTFAADSSLKEIAFPIKNGRYVKFVSLGDIMGSVAAAAAEIQAIGTGIPNKEINYTSLLGPDINVGVWSYPRADLSASSFEIEANKNYVIKNSAGTVLGSAAGSAITKVRYYGDKKLRIYNSIGEVLVDREVLFEAADGNNSDLIFNAHRPNSTYDHYRGKIKLRYSDASTNVWVINILPMEQYVWGIGEMTGTGDIDYNRAMTTTFRTYGYWKLLYGTKYATEGFKVDSTSSSQIYRGYEWETTYPRIKEAAEYTRGKVMRYGTDFALSPFSSWTDGRTRSFQERWGSTIYPWCQSVPDPYGKHPTMTTAQLEAGGNHMVGISAHGALNLATNYNWDWDRILKYYLTGITINQIY